MCLNRYKWHQNRLIEAKIKEASVPLSPTQNIENEAIENESSGSIKEYPIAGVVELGPILTQGTKGSHLGQYPLQDRPRMKNLASWQNTLLPCQREMRVRVIHEW